MALLLALLALQESEEPKPRRDPDPSTYPSLSVLPSYFQIHQPSLPDGFGATVVLHAPLSENTFLEAGGRWIPGDMGSDDFHLGVATLGLSKLGHAHLARFSVSAGAAILASGDLDDDVDFGVFAAFQMGMTTPEGWGITFLRYEVIVPETDAGIGGRDLELIQGFSFGLTVLF